MTAGVLSISLHKKKKNSKIRFRVKTTKKKYVVLIGYK